MQRQHPITKCFWNIPPRLASLILLLTFLNYLYSCLVPSLNTNLKSHGKRIRVSFLKAHSFNPWNFLYIRWGPSSMICRNTELKLNFVFIYVHTWLMQHRNIQKIQFLNFIILCGTSWMLNYVDITIFHVMCYQV